MSSITLEARKAKTTVKKLSSARSEYDRQMSVILDAHQGSLTVFSGNLSADFRKIGMLEERQIPIPTRCTDIDQGGDLKTLCDPVECVLGLIPNIIMDLRGPNPIYDHKVPERQ
jgi:hypothetical protein